MYVQIELDGRLKPIVLPHLGIQTLNRHSTNLPAEYILLLTQSLYCRLKAGNCLQSRQLQIIHIASESLLMIRLELQQLGQRVLQYANPAKTVINSKRKERKQYEIFSLLLNVDFIWKIIELCSLYNCRSWHSCINLTLTT